MSAMLLFAASFVVVFALGFQQLNVQHHLVRSAVATSLLIGLASVVQFKVLPGPTSVLDVLAYLSGNAAGIVAAMKAHPRFLARLRSRKVAAADELQRQVRNTIETIRHEGDAP